MFELVDRAARKEWQEYAPLRRRYCTSHCTLAPTRQHLHHYIMAPALPANNWFSPAQTSNFIVSPSELNPTQNGRYMGCIYCKLLQLTREGWN